MSWMNVRPYADSDTCRVPTRPSSWASGGIRHDFAPVWCGTSPTQACLARDPKGPSTSSCRKETCVGLRKAARDHAYVVVVSHSWVLLNSIRSALTHALPRLPCITLSTVFCVHPRLCMGMLSLPILLISCRTAFLCVLVDYADRTVASRIIGASFRP